MSRSTEWQRKADFWIGIPLVQAVSMYRRRRELPTNPRVIGLLSAGAIGDLILDTGLLLHLRNRFPGAAIHLYHSAANAGVIPLLPLEVTAHLCDFRDLRTTLVELRDSGLDLLVDMSPWPRLTALYAALCGSATVGFRSQGQFRHYAFDVAVPHLRSRHEVENLRALAEVFGPCGEYEVAVRSSEQRPRLGVAYERLVLCHVAPGGSRAELKSWPNSSWAAVIRHLVSAGFSVGLTGAAKDGPMVGEVLKLLGGQSTEVVSLCGDLTLSQLASALQACRLCITVDTGVLHLASALNVPTVALFGPSHSGRWGGISSRVANVDAPHEDAGFIHLGFETSPRGAEIMPSLTVSRVLTAVGELLQLAPARSDAVAIVKEGSGSDHH